jgi:hypothetical protein
MKTPTFLRSGLFFLAGLAAITAFAADEFRHVFITHVLTVTDGAGRKLFADGDTRLSILDRLGQPHNVLSQNVWLYRGFAAQNNTEAAKHFCDNLVVSFAPGKKYNDQKVGAIVMANAEGLKKIEKGLKENSRYLEDLLTGY